MRILFGLAILLALFAGLTVWRASRNEAAAEANHPPAGQFVEVNGNRVHYVEAGAGTAIVLIHGASGNVHDWTFDLFDRLSDRYRVIAFDRPGLGYTDDIGAPDAVEQARFLADATAALGVETPILAGHSFGGAVALAWALERPDELSGLLILAGVSHPWDTPTSAYYRTLSHPITGPVMAALLSAWVPQTYVEASVNGVFMPQNAPDGYSRHFGTDLVLRRFSLLENARQRTTLLPAIRAMAPRYGEISVPVEILHGDTDATVPLPVHSIPLSRAIDGANLVVMEGVGHMPHHADPGLVVEAIDRLRAASGLR